MGLFSQKRVPKREVTTTVKTYAQEFDREPVKQKKGLFATKKAEPEPQPQDTMQIENPNQEQNENQEENNYGGTY